MLSKFTFAAAAFLSFSNAFALGPLPKRDSSSCHGYADGSTYTTGGKKFLLSTDVVKSTNNLGGPIWDLSFTECVAACAADPDCVDLAYTGGSVCYLKKGLGVPFAEDGTCDAVLIPEPISSSTDLPACSPTTAISTATITESASTSTTTATSTLTVTALTTTTTACPTTTDPIINGSFESGMAPWMPLPGGTDGYVERASPGTNYKGSDQAWVIRGRIDATNPNLNQTFVQSLILCPGTTYRLTFTARRNLYSGQSSLQAFLGAGPDAAVVVATIPVSGWTSDTMVTYTGSDFAVPAGAQYSAGIVRFTIGFAQGTGYQKDTWVDNVKLTPVVGATPSAS
ncbi:uncharacterized protein BDZ99DRAFT_474277 [Mytilinidion resinicola]|uniref:Carbohydrate binding domain-containing protein n=1 Tax=Mytilinidion resinicola TaxID=574789 RepID=A0A6A6YU18_9PEZI|nr:uncharacterized protein BDZ99DRAFT_474277 [Mytilinidion resinicola]KAF2812038.1 hypothetical protein BDZ99DRAFT_474277 [Mytilinidion resinicola]